MTPAVTADPSLPLRRTTLRDAGVLTVFALAVNLAYIGAPSIALDESTSVAYARLHSDQFFDVITRTDPNQPLYYVILRFWLRIAGEGEAAVRVPSAVFGALAVGAVYWLGRRLFGRGAGLLAAWLLALNAFMVEYAQTARAYALLVLLVSLSSLFFVCALQTPSRLNRALYVAASALSVYAHFFAGFVVIVHLLVLIASLRWKAMRSPWRGTLMAIAIGWLPIVVAAYRRGPAGRIDWIAPVRLVVVRDELLSLAGGSAFVLGLLLVAGGYGLLAAGRPHRRWPHAFAAAWLLLPVALSFLISLAQPMFLSRYLIICVPALTLLGAGGIVRMPSRAAAAVLVAVLTIANVERLRAYYGSPSLQDWRAASGYMLEAIQPDDRVVCFPAWACKPLHYYARQRSMPEPRDHAGRSLAGTGRVWFLIRTSDIAGYGDAFARQHSALHASVQLSERREYGTVAVELYTR